MAEYDNTNTGALFQNDQGDNPKRPQWKGKLNVNGTDYWVSGWERTSKGGQDFLSLKVEPVEQKAEKREAVGGSNRGWGSRPAAAPAAPANPPPTEAELNDDIPF